MPIALLRNRLPNLLFTLIYRYKLLHISFWVWHWLSLAHVMLNNRYPKLNTFQCYGNSFGVVLVQIGCVYTIINYLLPRYFKKGRYWPFIFYSLITIILFSILNLAVDLVYTGIHHTSVMYIAGIVSAIYDMSMIVFFFVSVVIVRSKYHDEQHKKKLEKERLEAELNFLKAQINPHFLFNSFNTIYVLMEEDRHLAREVFIRFTELLRYQLYDCSANRTPIEKEIELLRNYIEIEKIRKSENIDISFTIKESIEHFFICPFLLVPFVENAFKHISYYADRKNTIDISLSTEHDVFIFNIVNTYNHSARKSKEGGIGLQNVQRRLDLLYKDRYELDIIKDETQFQVLLKLKINENELHHN